MMNKLFLLGLTMSVLALSGCSKKDEQVRATPTPASTPDAARLKADSERLQQATSNAAREREKAAQPSPTPAASAR
jgi:outer membrane murein-binding lipoprotein Lpp